MTTKESEVDVSRQQFEEAMRSVWWGDSFHAERHPKAPDEYLKAPEQMAWIGWKAARTQPPSPKEPDMNTTTNTRGVSEAMKLADAYAESAWNDAVDGVGTRSKQTDEARAALEAALSAEPAAQGEAVHQYRHKGSSDWYDGVLAEPDAEFETRTLYTAPPAQPAERVPEGWTANRWVSDEGMFHLSGPDGVEVDVSSSDCSDEGRFLCRLAQSLLASPAPSPARGDGKEGDDTFARELYIASQCDVHNLHTLAWHELTEKQRDEWRKKATGAAR